MPQQITQEEVSSLDQHLTYYHAQHAGKFGAKETCVENACREAKMAIAWLHKRLHEREDAQQ